MANNSSDQYRGSNRVHFPADQVNQHDSQIIVEYDEEKKNFEVHLGFLQLHHEYLIEFSIKDNLREDLLCDPLQSLNVKLIQAKSTDDGQGHHLNFSFKAEKEKLMVEKLELKSSSTPSLSIFIRLHARVLGKGKGTPALKSGIHLTQTNTEEDSHASDWQGFD